MSIFRIHLDGIKKA
ncbi:hypothetical protein AB9C59_09970 [Escherichia coli]|nr:hypothetical protein [Escherichia coli]MCA8675356.1 hypothetical protein [Escherichia coli]MDC6742275.1 hypothetical protein [Escherichia coli]MDC6897239.1 hypothetical protein [Escherichia coli]MDC6901652.1 hypothetical protein [Escherichia coli]MDC6906236.1 hypothetical protein [Escherichia coli]